MTSKRSTTLSVSRRGYLKNGAIGLASAAALVGSASAWRLEDQYGTVIDVTEEGADDQGNESITPVLRRLADDDTLLTFPEGRYYMDSQFRFTNFQNFGMVGYDATLVPATYHDFDGPRYRLFRMGTYANPGRDLRVEGFRVDQTADDTGIRVLNAEVEDGLIVQDVYIHGVHDSGTWGPGLFNILDSNGSGVVRRFRAFDGGLHADDTPNAGNMGSGPTGILTNGNHRGTIRYEGCVLGGFPGTGLYVGCPDGRVVVDQGWFQNSDTASIRLGVDTARIENAVVAVSRNPDRDTSQLPIRLDYGNWITVDGVDVRMSRPNGNAIRVRNGVDGAYIRNSSISISGSNPATAIRIYPDAGPTYIKNVDIDMGVSGYALRVDGDDAGEVGVQDVRISGDGGGSPIQHAIYCERNGCRFRDLEVDQPGDSRRRAMLLTGRDYIVYNCDFRSTNYPIRIEGDDVWIENCYGSAYDDSASVRLSGAAGSVVLKNNTFPDGVSDGR